VEVVVVPVWLVDVAVPVWLVEGPVLPGAWHEASAAPAARVPRPARNFRRVRNRRSGVISDDFIFFTVRAPLC
jgi:hypothetical protein